MQARVLSEAWERGKEAGTQSLMNEALSTMPQPTGGTVLPAQQINEGGGGGATATGCPLCLAC